MGGYDIGASASLSSGATSGNTGAVDISGGNSGAASTPNWVWLAVAATVFVIVVVFLKRGRKK